MRRDPAPAHALVMEVVVKGVEIRWGNVLSNNAHAVGGRNVIRRFERAAQCSRRGFDRNSFRVYGATPRSSEHRARIVLVLLAWWLAHAPLADSTEDI